MEHCNYVRNRGEDRLKSALFPFWRCLILIKSAPEFEIIILRWKQVRCRSEISMRVGVSKAKKKNKMPPERNDDPGHSDLRPHTPFRLAAVAFVLFGVIGAFFIAAIPGGTFAESIGQTLQYLVSPWMLATEAIAAGFLVYGFIFLRSSPWKARDAATVEGLLGRQRLRLLLVMGVFSLGLLGIGAFFAFDLEREAHQQAIVQVQTVARLKAQQVDKWLYERSIDTELAGASLQQLPLDQWSSSADVRQIAGVLFSEILAGHPERIAVTLFAPDGRVLVRIGQETALSAATDKIVELASRKSRLQILLTDLKGSTPPRPGVSFVLPIMKAPATDTPMALLEITIDPSIQLLGQIREWPVPSISGEVLLVRRDGDDVAYVTPPRLLDPDKVTPGSMRLPLATKGLIAAEAILQGDGPHEGRDYRGVEALAASSRIKGIDWYVLAKIDHDEIGTSAHRKIRTLAMVVAGAILLAGLMSALLWHGQRAGVLAYHMRQEAERAAITRHYERMVASVRDAVFLTDPQSNIVEANAAAVKNYGYSVAEFRTMNAKALRAPEEQPKFELQWRPVVEQLGHLYQTVHRRKDGTTFPVEVANNAFDSDGAIYYQAFIRDISVQRQVARLARVQKALFDAGSVLLRAQSEDELFRDMCRILVEDGGYRLANVAVPNHDEGKTIRFLTIAGEDDGYLAGTHISWGSGPQSIGPTGTAIREGVIQVNQDFKTNPRMAPWREAALTRGVQSSVSLPLRVSGQIFGALTIYAAQPDAFDADELAMLTRFAEDIDFGLEKLRASQGTRPAQQPTASG